MSGYTCFYSIPNMPMLVSYQLSRSLEPSNRYCRRICLLILPYSCMYEQCSADVYCSPVANVVPVTTVLSTSIIRSREIQELHLDMPFRTCPSKDPSCHKIKPSPCGGYSYTEPDNKIRVKNRMQHRSITMTFVCVR